MQNLPRAFVLLLLSVTTLCCQAGEPADCFADEVHAHVLEQFQIYGPQSTDREYFGYIFRINGVIDSATTRGGTCRWKPDCEVKTADAAAKIPKGAKVLGEWHTHPHTNGSSRLSPDDVQGANDNRHIRCYRAFFSTSEGNILSWDPNTAEVSAAMAAAVQLGNYRYPSRNVQQYAASSP